MLAVWKVWSLFDHGWLPSKANIRIREWGTRERYRLHVHTLWPYLHMHIYALFGIIYNWKNKNKILLCISFYFGNTKIDLRTAIILMFRKQNSAHCRCHVIAASDRVGCHLVWHAFIKSFVLHPKGHGRIPRIIFYTLMRRW